MKSINSIIEIILEARYLSNKLLSEQVAGAVEGAAEKMIIDPFESLLRSGEENISKDVIDNFLDMETHGIKYPTYEYEQLAKKAFEDRIKQSIVQGVVEPKDIMRDILRQRPDLIKSPEVVDTLRDRINTSVDSIRKDVVGKGIKTITGVETIPTTVPSTPPILPITPRTPLPGEKPIVIPPHFDPNRPFWRPNTKPETPITEPETPPKQPQPETPPTEPKPVIPPENPPAKPPKPTFPPDEYETGKPPKEEEKEDIKPHEDEKPKPGEGEKTKPSEGEKTKPGEKEEIKPKSGKNNPLRPRVGEPPTEEGQPREWGLPNIFGSQVNGRAYAEQGEKIPLDLGLGLEAIGQFSRRQVMR